MVTKPYGDIIARILTKYFGNAYVTKNNDEAAPGLITKYRSFTDQRLPSIGDTNQWLPNVGDIVTWLPSTVTYIWTLDDTMQCILLTVSLLVCSCFAPLPVIFHNCVLLAFS